MITAGIIVHLRAALPQLSIPIRSSHHRRNEVRPSPSTPTDNFAESGIITTPAATPTGTVAPAVLRRPACLTPPRRPPGGRGCPLPPAVETLVKARLRTDSGAQVPQAVPLSTGIPDAATGLDRLDRRPFTHLAFAEAGRVRRVKPGRVTTRDDATRLPLPERQGKPSAPFLRL